MPERVPLLTPDEAAAELKISTKTLRRLRDRGLRYVMLTSGTIRYRADDLAEFVSGKVQECRSEPRPAASGSTTSRSRVVDFSEAAARKTSRKPRQ
ncbi:helix-turn-helix domain-containing protein [Albidovulum marisflavi]|uniref:helix-turn-helix domain-containing protein n=1 Tax=Albidovulum marisflavi TaxID=2984159 RepID=UPI00399126DC